VYFSHKYVETRAMQFILFLASVGLGFQSMQLIGNVYTNQYNMRLAPGLSTIWAYTVMQLNLNLAVMGVITVMVAHYGSIYFLNDQ
jgi:hypothetical protein